MKKRAIRKKAEILSGIKKGLKEIHELKVTGKKLETLTDFLKRITSSKQTTRP
jgi:hypothetical protein